MYFYIKPINNNTYYNRESLELIKNLQSLGVGATGRLSTDRQTLQIAEYQKLKQTLGPSNEQRIQNAPVQFDTMLQAGAQPQAAEAMAGQNAISVQGISEISNAAKEQTGATQLAELNKYMLGIAA